MSKYVIEYEDTPSSREDGVNYYKCKDVPWLSNSKNVIDHLKPYDETEPFAAGLAQMYEAVGVILTMSRENRYKWFGSPYLANIFTNRYDEFFDKYHAYKKDLTSPKAGDVVEFGGVRYLIVGMDESSYHVLSGRSFEVDRIFKSLEKEIHRLNDRKDLDLVAKALKGET